MNRNPYRTFGTEISFMYGRAKNFQRLSSLLTKPSPDHVCVVGPARFGKSVFLSHLAQHFQKVNPSYLTAVYWDLRHQTPENDHEFLKKLGKCVREALQSVNSEIAEYLSDEEDLYDMLELVFKELEEGDQRLLVILDGFDHLMDNTEITRHLWDRLRNLAQLKSLRLVTGSRKKLRELCKTEASRTSDFWEVFNPNPIELGCFEDAEDWNALLAPFESENASIHTSGLTELQNWTGGVPLLVCGLLEILYEDVSKSKEFQISKKIVDDAAESAITRLHELLEMLWDDCSTELKTDLVFLSHDPLAMEQIPKIRQRQLELRGFAQVSKNTLRSSCRLMERFAQTQEKSVGDLHRLFGESTQFEQNIRALLELRLTQISSCDSELRGNVQDAIRDLLEPRKSIKHARSIAEQALELIWKKELPIDGSLPSEWLSYWKSVGEWIPERGQFPQELGLQCKLLLQSTGTWKARNRVAKWITKPTALLVDWVQAVGNLGQHKQGISVSIGFAAAFCLAAIELCESIERDFASGAS